MLRWRNIFGWLIKPQTKEHSIAMLEIYDKHGTLIECSVENPDNERDLIVGVDPPHLFSDEELDSLFDNWDDNWDAPRVNWKKEGF